MKLLLETSYLSYLRQLEEAIQRSGNDSKKSFSLDFLLNELKNTLKKYYFITKDDFYIFGSAILGKYQLRKLHDLDIAISTKKFKELQQKTNKKFCDKGSYCVQMDIGNISFIDERVVPKGNKDFEFYKGYKIITNSTWIDMQKKDPDQKDKKFIKQLSKIRN
jgi:predicted nucleotidyltransferase